MQIIEHSDSTEFQWDPEGLPSFITGITIANNITDKQRAALTRNLKQFAVGKLISTRAVEDIVQNLNKDN